MASDTLDKLIKAAKPGDTVTLPAGSYEGQTVTYDASKEGATSRVIVQAKGAVLNSLEVLGLQHVEIHGLTINGLWNVRPSTGNSWTSSSKAPKDLVFEDFDCKTFLLRNLQDSVIRNCRIGGWDASITPLGPPKIGAYPNPNGPSVLSKNVVIEDCFFHDMLRTLAGTAHAEGFYFDAGVDGFTLRRCFFTNCGVFDIFSNGPIGDRPITNVLIEDCLLDVARDGSGGGAGSTVNLKGGASNWTFRGNSILGQGGTLRNDSAPYPGFVFENNAIQNGSFGWIGAAVWKNNVMSVPGTTGSKQANPVGFVAASIGSCNLNSCYRNDLHVKPDSPAGLAGAGVPVDETTPPPDTEAPTVTITSPANADVVKGAIALSSAVADNVGVMRTEYYCDGVLVAQNPFDTTQIADGEHVFVAKAYDAEGNVGTSEPVTVSVDNIIEPQPMVRLLDEGDDYYLIGWDPISDSEGYRFTLGDDVKRPHTWNPMIQRDPNFPACNTRVEKGHATYKVEVLSAEEIGIWSPK